jgi:hypothetical protein
MNDARLAHRGDPCAWCHQSHDAVAPGQCPAFESEIRPPQEGEEFLGQRGRETARFDFSATAFPIFRQGYREFDAPLAEREKGEKT